MRRRAWIICVVVAALVLAVMWVRSYFVSHAIGHGRQFTASDGGYRIRFVMVRSSRGAVYFGAGYSLPIFLVSGPAREGWFLARDAASPPANRTPAAWSGLGFSFHRVDLPTALVTRSLGVPYWFLVSCATAVLIVPWMQRRRACREAGKCPTCGYDLRESRERCPECGTPIPQWGGADKSGAVAKDGVRQS